MLSDIIEYVNHYLSRKNATTGAKKDIMIVITTTQTTIFLDFIINYY